MKHDQIEIEIIENDAEELVVEAKIGRRQIGYAGCERRGDRLQVCDLRIDENHRRRGLGTAMLRLLLDTADAAGVGVIWGEVTADDIQNWPGLLAWYERFGFTVQIPDDECIKIAVKKIVRQR